MSDLKWETTDLKKKVGKPKKKQRKLWSDS